MKKQIFPIPGRPLLISHWLELCHMDIELQETEEKQIFYISNPTSLSKGELRIILTRKLMMCVILKNNKLSNRSIYEIKRWKNDQYCTESQGQSEKVEIVLKGIHALIKILKIQQ